MGEVVSFGAAVRTKKKDFKDFIDEAYDCLARLPFYMVRSTQTELSRKILTSFSNGVPLMAEAPTGTGKTLAYLVAALAAQEGQSRPMPVVVATATALLQHQIIDEEIPKLVSAGLINLDQVVVAKGRGRYFCAAAASRASSDEDRQDDMFEGDSNMDVSKFAEDLLELFESGKWNGDMDTAPQQISFRAREAVKASGESCMGWRCSYYQSCPYFVERKRLQQAKIIIANQDLVLSDLKLAREEDGSTIFPVKSYLLVVDEAHRFPGKAQEAGSALIECEHVLAILEDIPTVLGKVLRHPKVAHILEKDGNFAEQVDPSVAIEAFAKVRDFVFGIEDDGNDAQITLKSAREDSSIADLQKNVHEAYAHCDRIAAVFAKAKSDLSEVKFPDSDPVARKAFFDAWYQVSFNSAKIGAIRDELDAFLSCTEGVRWVEIRHSLEKTRTLRASPLEGGSVLKALLWNTDRAKVVLVSATLSAFGKFERFANEVGIGENGTSFVVKPSFKYENSTLVVKRLKHSPKHSERAEYEAELCRELPKVIKQDQATLVLYPSRKLLTHGAEVLRSYYKEAVLAQGSLPIARLTELHKERVDAGKQSILCGLSSLSEGLDLPGKYCSHVIIAALPFSPPISPVEKRYQAIMGNRYFPERAMPDALLKLKQMVGRLLRSESDKGIITVMDHRLSSTKWGRSMLESLPPYRFKEEGA